MMVWMAICALVLAFIVGAMQDQDGEGWFVSLASALALFCQLSYGAIAYTYGQREYTCEQAQLEVYERRVIDDREEQCMPDGRVWRLPR